jgi:hypothetical protein
MLPTRYMVPHAMSWVTLCPWNEPIKLENIWSGDKDVCPFGSLPSSEIVLLFTGSNNNVPHLFTHLFTPPPLFHQSYCNICLQALGRREGGPPKSFSFFSFQRIVSEPSPKWYRQKYLRVCYKYRPPISARCPRSHPLLRAHHWPRALLVPHEVHIPSWHVGRISSSHSLARGSSWAGNLGSGLNINTILHMVFNVSMMTFWMTFLMNKWTNVVMDDGWDMLHIWLEMALIWLLLMFTFDVCFIPYIDQDSQGWNFVCSKKLWS